MRCLAVKSPSYLSLAPFQAAVWQFHGRDLHSLVKRVYDINLMLSHKQRMNRYENSQKPIHIPVTSFSLRENEYNNRPPTSFFWQNCICSYVTWQCGNAVKVTWQLGFLQICALMISALQR